MAKDKEIPRNSSNLDYATDSPTYDRATMFAEERIDPATAMRISKEVHLDMERTYEFPMTDVNGNGS